MSNLTKIAIATLGVGTASGAGAAGYYDNSISIVEEYCKD